MQTINFTGDDSNGFAKALNGLRGYVVNVEQSKGKSLVEVTAIGTEDCLGSCLIVEDSFDHTYHLQVSDIVAVEVL